MVENPTQSGTPSNYLPPASPAENEGHTFAAWFTMIGVMVGSLVFAVGMIFVSAPVLIVGALLILVGMVGGMFLRRAGRGQPLG